MPILTYACTDVTNASMHTVRALRGSKAAQTELPTAGVKLCEQRNAMCDTLPRHKNVCLCIHTK